MQENLTLREQEISDLLLEGVSPKEIAYKLNISGKTVDTHKTNIYKKLDIHSYRELVSKFLPADNSQFNSEKLSEKQPEPEKNKLNKKVLIPAGITVFVLILYLIIMFFVNNSIKNKSEDASSLFTMRTFDTIYLRAVKHNDGIVSIHEYEAEIPFSDIYTGNVRDIIPYAGYLDEDNWLKLRLSGTVDKLLDTMTINIALREPNGNYHHLAGGGNMRFSSIGPGEFSEIFYVSGSFHENMAVLSQDELPEGVIIFSLSHALKNTYGAYSFNNGEIPDNIPNGTIMATIRNLKIEPFFNH